MINIPRSPLARLRALATSLHPRHTSTTPNPRSNQRWPLDPRGEEIRTAKARRLGINTSVQKLNLVAKLVRNLTISEAHRQLTGCNKKTAPLVRDTIDAAVTNARAFGLDEHRLIISEAFVGKGVYLRRLRPWHGKGRFGIEHKKYSHLTVRVRELDEELWEAKVLPQYVHMRRTSRARDHDRNHPIRISNRVSWISDLDETFRKTTQSVVELRAALHAKTKTLREST